MAAKHVDRRAPLAGEANSGLLPNGFASLWFKEGRVVEEFLMNQPVPPYLFAFAVGELGFREVGPRTRVYSEAVEAASREFVGTEELIRQGEKLFGPYEWERFDLLVLPPENLLRKTLWDSKGVGRYQACQLGKPAVRPGNT